MNLKQIKQMFTLFRFQSFSNPECNAGFVQSLIGHQRHLELVPDPQHEEASLHTVDGGLSDELVEALGVELPPDLADPRLPGLSLLQLLVQLLLQVHHVQPGGGGRADRLPPQLALLLPLPRRQDAVQDLLCLILTLPGACVGLSV